MFKNIKIRESVLEEHRWDVNMICTECGISKLNIDIFKNANELPFLTCKDIQMMQERERFCVW